MLWRNSKESVVFEKFCKFHRKTSPWNCRLCDTYWECFPGKFLKFSEQLSQETPATPASAISCHWKMFQPKYIFSKNISFGFSHLFFDIQWHLFPGIKCITDVQELNIWISHIVIFKLLFLKLKNMSSYIQNISVFTTNFKNYKTYFKPLISGKIIF